MAIKRQDKSKIVQIWGEILDNGFTTVPNILLLYRTKLKIKAPQLALIIDIMSFKWDKDNPFPSYSVLAERGDMTERHVMRIIQELEKMKLLIRTQRFDEGTGVQITTVFDFRPMIEKLTEEMHKEKTEGGEEPNFPRGVKNNSGGGRVTKMSGWRVTNLSPSRVTKMSPELDSKEKKTHLMHPTKVVKSISRSPRPYAREIRREDSLGVQREFRNGIFRKRLFEVYDNLQDIKKIEELVEEAAYRACKEIIVNRANELSAKKAKISPDEISAEVRAEFPYEKMPESEAKARKFFVASICDLTADKISRLWGEKSGKKGRNGILRDKV